MSCWAHSLSLPDGLQEGKRITMQSAQDLSQRTVSKLVTQNQDDEKRGKSKQSGKERGGTLNTSLTTGRGTGFQ